MSSCSDATVGLRSEQCSKIKSPHTRDENLVAAKNYYGRWWTSAKTLPSQPSLATCVNLHIPVKTGIAAISLVTRNSYKVTIRHDRVLSALTSRFAGLSVCSSAALPVSQCLLCSDNVHPAYLFPIDEPLCLRHKLRLYLNLNLLSLLGGSLAFAAVHRCGLHVLGITALAQECNAFFGHAPSSSVEVVFGTEGASVFFVSAAASAGIRLLVDRHDSCFPDLSPF